MTQRQEMALEDDLDAALYRLGGELQYPRAPDLSQTVRQRLLDARCRASPWRVRRATPRRQLAGILLAGLLLAVLALGLWPAARQTIAERFGVPGIEIRFRETPQETSGTLQLSPTPAPAATPAATPIDSPVTPAPPRAFGVPMSLEEAQRRVPFRIVLPAALGEPDAVYVDERGLVPVVTLVYRPRPPEIPASQVIGVGLLIMQFQGTPGEPLFMKGVGPEGVIEPVTVHRRFGYWISGGPHLLIARTPGGEWQDESRLASNTLLWASDGLTLRLEGEVTKETALAIAESMR